MKSEQEYLKQAEEMANTAQKLAEQHEKESNIDEPTLKKVPVIGTEEQDDNYYINLVISVGSDEQKTVKIPWPDDTTDMSEPLVRLVQFYDVSIDDITELREIWVYTNNGQEYDVLIPPENSDKFMNITHMNNKLYAVESIKRNILKIFVSSIFSSLLLYLAFTNLSTLTTTYKFGFLVVLFMNIFYITSKISELYKTNNKSIGKIHKL